jgi:diguanylate cyclase (GGDEF)-like protein/PAS domain S-box-containing protein
MHIEQNNRLLNIDDNRLLDPQSEALLEANPYAVAIVDNRGTIRFVNARLVHLIEFAKVELVNRDIGQLVPGATATSLTDFDNARTSKRRSQLHRQSSAHPIFINGKPGNAIPVDIVTTPIVLNGEEMSLCTIRDHRPDIDVLEQLATLHMRFDETQQTARIGSWEHDLTSDYEWWSDSLFRILQVSPDSTEKLFDLFIQRVHPEDRRKVTDRIRRGSAGQPVESLDVRIVLPDGSMRVMHSHAATKVDATGKPVRLHGTLQDITERKALEQRSRDVEQRYRDAQRISRIGNWEWDLASDTSWWSDELYDILEEKPENCEPSFEAFLERVHPDDRWMCIRSREATESRVTDTHTLLLRLITRKGRIKYAESIIEAQLDESGNLRKATGTIHDITERHELERQLRESEVRYSSTVELAALGIAHVGTRGDFMWANKHLLDMLGYSLDEIQGLTIADVSHPDDIDISTEGRQQLHRGEIPSLTLEKRYLRKDGAVVWVQITSAVNRDEDGNPVHDIAIVEDISSRKFAEQRVQYLATHDEMTGLHNRAMFSEMLTHAIESARRRSRSCSVLFIDLDRFKIVNDSLGHGAGDQLIIEMAKRIKRCVRAADVVARLGGDEFVILLEELETDAAAEDIAKRILSAMLVPIQIQGQECRVTASIGIAHFPKDAVDSETLMKHADMAMYLAKDEGKNNYQAYSADKSPMSVERLVLETHLARALENNEFTVLYQPKVDIRTDRINGVEALLRWWNPELGTISPAQFIPVAEDTGLIVPIGKWVLRQACEQNIAWQKTGLPSVTMAVNLSPRQFADAALLQDITEVLNETGMSAEFLELEITESMIMHNVDRAASVLDAIRNLGVRLAIDDFGTGYSSLSQLKRFPIDTLKIDRSFIRDIPENLEDMAITEAIISLGRTLGVSVIAEGVETPKQLAFLRQRSCDAVQGYLFSKPCTADALTNVLRENLLSRSG